ncbi:MAG: hypothetical protein WC379_00825 [Methanoregula sp.]|jgi:hypothetical protein
MKKTTIIIIITALLCGVIAAGFFSGLFGTLIRPRPEAATVDYLIEVQKKPSADYISELELIIQKNKNQTVRDVAVNTLTSIAMRKGETDKVIGFLKDLTVNEKDPVIMSAAYAGIDRIRDKYPLPSMGSLDLSVNGKVKKGGEVAIIATFSSTTDMEKAVLSLDFPGDSVEMINVPVYYTNLTANTPVTYTFQLRILETGQFKVPVELMVSTDRTDYEQIERVVLFDVRENDGEYRIV